jgi:hypothetical protein
MRFAFPRFPAEFEIPNEWWSEAGMQGFRPRGSAYTSANGDLIQLNDIEPPFRLKQTSLTANGFNRERVLSILKGFRTDAQLPPIDLLRIPPTHDISGDPFKLRVVDGFHRFYMSIAVGFEFVPASLREVWL